MNLTLHYSDSGDLITDAKRIIEEARTYAYSAINVTLVQRNWLLGKRIAEEELKGEDRAVKRIWERILADRFILVFTILQCLPGDFCISE